MRKIGSTFLGALLGAVVLLGVGSTAHALNVTPDTANWETLLNNNLNSTHIETITGFTGLSLLYKSDFGGGEDGSLQSSYNTTFLPAGGEPSGFTVSYVSGSFASCPTCILVVKDGNHNPAQYLFNLGNWNGQAPINGSGFWPNGGAISNVAVWGTGSSVPVPGTSLLFGLGMTLFAGWHRKHARQI